MKTYRTRRGDVAALNDVNVLIEKGEFVVICGSSGSGKTTMLMTIAAMLHPTSGTVSVEQNNLYAMSIQARARFRAENIGFVFQMFHLVPYLNILENILLAGGTVAGNNKNAKALELIEQFGLSGRNHHKPAELSAGEKQRTAIARALLNNPQIILADEPTGNLDTDNATSVLGYLSEFHKAGGTVILATHGSEAERFADRIINLHNGKIANPEKS
ncbi:MAG: ATP-binding cassette domain-containing protein [Phycisphaerae bacterium]|nr:ABC transporter ATP-binding protein [Phycisphaerae bacterium]NIR65704.1 ABC transporter ATP-binding protein [candidate division Zixibacteria bacterium]NIP52767.1 ABC transporter ATP-binding protein [Phycisphaerae bacterium]NIS52058.1 ABC transporter ATP-binding protein [Phycisphaerae bacterium]NIU09597.1 ABC transporter ATP-binding protein [Phycisphaerae bacterium]